MRVEQPESRPGPIGGVTADSGLGHARIGGQPMGDAGLEKLGDRRIAVPLEGGLVAEHFGHCEAFAIFEIAAAESTITEASVIPAPPHRPGFLPGWLRELGVDVIIAGGMGARASELLREEGIEVVVGAPRGGAREVVRSYLDQTLTAGSNPCDH